MAQVNLGGEVVEEWQNLQERFGCPPISTLDTKQEYWQAKRKKWLMLGIESEVGRPDNLCGNLADIVERKVGYDDKPEPKKEEDRYNTLETADGRDNNLLGMSKLCMLKKNLLEPCRVYHQVCHR